MNWQDICDNPLLRELPFKIETNKWGHIEMSPASNQHGLYQVLIIEWLLKLCPDGRPIAECSVQTSQGVKVADVAWGSYGFFRRNRLANPYQESPEIVVEIVSPANTTQEMMEKKELYFARGAREFWLCDKDGRMTFYDNHRELPNSELAGGFPARIDIDFA
ncbi:MAG: Uma2 family endonuclease [Pseudomonadota bacterium]|nr:Uma2 family endonuclease [Pseudomonadota bacterium]